MQSPKRFLGQTDIEITPIGLGSWQFSGSLISTSYWAPLTHVNVDGIVEAACEGGINWFDTAELYGFGRSEKALSHALTASGKSNGDIVIATKWFPAYRTAGWIQRTINKRIENLHPFEVDLHQIHFSNSLSSIEEQMDTMAGLLEQHKIKAIGVSNFSEALLRRAHKKLSERGLPLASVQMRYNILDRSIEKNGVLSAAQELGITVIAYSPLQLGLLSGKFHRQPDLVDKLPRLRKKVIRPMLERSRKLMFEMERIAADYGVTPAQIALNW
ncbi:MAG: aldo/keto reductase, partial [Dehalococcoidia bacterium]